jgi:hypothetical protein
LHVIYSETFKGAALLAGGPIDAFANSDPYLEANRTLIAEGSISRA